MSEIIVRLARRAGVTPDQCRAVLEALRKPEPEMVDAGIDAAVTCSRSSDDSEACIWQAMVECALEPDCRVWGETGDQPGA